ncbi:MAG: 50S ribosomal protein L25 [Patescibacteria group bacterium]
MLTLKGEVREGKKKLAALRAEGFLPAVYYGHKEKPVSCVFSMGEFKKVWKTAGESTVVVLDTPKGKVNTLIYDVQMDPLRDEPIHADFYVIEKGQEVEVHIPLEFKGVSGAVKDLGGTLVKVLHEIEIKALPENLPHDLVVDIALLTTLEGQILAKDIELPKGVTLVTLPTEVVAAISVAKEEVEEAPVVDLSKIEVEKKGKKEEEVSAAE